MATIQVQRHETEKAQLWAPGMPHRLCCKSRGHTTERPQRDTTSSKTGIDTWRELEDGPEIIHNKPGVKLSHKEIGCVMESRNPFYLSELPGADERQGLDEIESNESYEGD